MNDHTAQLAAKVVALEEDLAAAQRALARVTADLGVAQGLLHRAGADLEQAQRDKGAYRRSLEDANQRVADQAKLLEGAEREIQRLASAVAPTPAPCQCGGERLERQAAHDRANAVRLAARVAELEEHLGTVGSPA